MASETAKLELVNKFSKYGFRRRPTCDEIADLVGENKDLLGKLPDRTATQFKSSPEGSYLDGIEHLEALKDEQNRILETEIRNLIFKKEARNHGNTFHLSRLQKQSTLFRQPPQQPQEPQQPIQPMDVKPPPTNLPMSRMLQMELDKRQKEATVKRSETADAHATSKALKGHREPFVQQIFGITPPQILAPQTPQITTPEYFDLTLSDTPKKVNVASIANANIPASSSQAPLMDLTSPPKRNNPETMVEPRGKAGRPKMFKAGTERPDTTKREGDEIPEETRNTKRVNKNKEKQRLRLEAKMQKQGKNDDNEAEPENVKERKGSRVRKTIQKAIAPSKIGIQVLREEFETAHNKKIIGLMTYRRYEELFNEWKKAKKTEKSKKRKELRDMYRDELYKKIKNREMDDL